MLTPTPAGTVWPVRLAYCAAAIFTLASAGTNLHYGISKRADAASSAVWGAVSLAVSIVFALSWPALIRAVQHSQWALGSSRLDADGRLQRDGGLGIGIRWTCGRCSIGDGHGGCMVQGTSRL